MLDKGGYIGITVARYSKVRYAFLVLWLDRDFCFLKEIHFEMALRLGCKVFSGFMLPVCCLEKSDKQYDSCALIGCNEGIDFSNHEDIYHGPSVDQWQVLFVGRDESRSCVVGISCLSYYGTCRCGFLCGLFVDMWGGFRIVLSGEESSDASSRRYSCCLRYLVGCWIIDRGVVICGFASLGLWGHFRFAMCFLLSVTIHGGDSIAEFRSYLPTFGYVLAINQL